MSKTATLILVSLGMMLVQPALAQTMPHREASPVIKRQIVKQKVDTIKEKMATREAALKLKLQAFRDQKKATAAARISDNLNKINTRETEQMLKHLDMMTTLLNKLEARVNKATPDIKDQASAKGAIATARSAIASASAAVSVQAQKDYTIQVSSEAAVKSDAQKVRELLRTDLQAIRKLVITAKQAVANAVRVAKSGKLEIPKKEATPSGTQ